MQLFDFLLIPRAAAGRRRPINRPPPAKLRLAKRATVSGPERAWTTTGLWGRADPGLVLCNVRDQSSVRPRRTCKTDAQSCASALDVDEPRPTITSKCALQSY